MRTETPNLSSETEQHPLTPQAKLHQVMSGQTKIAGIKIGVLRLCLPWLYTGDSKTNTFSLTVANPLKPDQTIVIATGSPYKIKLPFDIHEAHKDMVDYRRIRNLPEEITDDLRQKLNQEVIPNLEEIFKNAGANVINRNQILTDERTFEDKQKRLVAVTAGFNKLTQGQESFQKQATTQALQKLNLEVTKKPGQISVAISMAKAADPAYALIHPVPSGTLQVIFNEKFIDDPQSLKQETLGLSFYPEGDAQNADHLGQVRFNTKLVDVYEKHPDPNKRLSDILQTAEQVLALLK